MSLKLAFLHAEAGSLDAARMVLLTAQCTAERARSESNRLLEGSEDERFRIITASRNHPDIDVASHTACMTEEEQIVASMHADIVLLLADVELRLGVREQAARATRTCGKKASALQKRRDHVRTKPCIYSHRCTQFVSIYRVWGRVRDVVRCMQVALLGTLTRTEERRLTEAMHAAAACATNCVATERALMATAGKNPYQQALLLIRMAPFQSDQHAQVRIFTKYLEILGCKFWPMNACKQCGTQDVIISYR